MRKMGSFVYLSCSRPDLWSFKQQKGVIFIFSADDSKKIITFYAKYKSASERSNRVLSETGMVLMLPYFGVIVR